MIDENDDSPYSDELHEAVGALWHSENNPNPTGSRGAAQVMLAKLAAGDRSSEALLFAKALAASLLAAGGEKSGDEKSRAGKVLAASGLGGRLAKVPQWVEDALRLDGFEGWSAADEIRNARHKGTLSGDIDDTTARKQLDRERKRRAAPHPQTDEELDAARELGL